MMAGLEKMDGKKSGNENGIGQDVNQNIIDNREFDTPSLDMIKFNHLGTSNSKKSKVQRNIHRKTKSEIKPIIVRRSGVDSPSNKYQQLVAEEQFSRKM